VKFLTQKKARLFNSRAFVLYNKMLIQCPSKNGIFWFPASPERVFNRRHSALFRELKTSENAAGGREMPFMDGH
ncbi:MAG: hypothetical protein PVJ06_07680, partial [Desulfobacterales bacterium]